MQVASKPVAMNKYPAASPSKKRAPPPKKRAPKPANPIDVDVVQIEVPKGSNVQVSVTKTDHESSKNNYSSDQSDDVFN